MRMSAGSGVYFGDGAEKPAAVLETLNKITRN
jgi:hypothetical protein